MHAVYIVVICNVLGVHRRHISITTKQDKHLQIRNTKLYMHVFILMFTCKTINEHLIVSVWIHLQM